MAKAIILDTKTAIFNALKLKSENATISGGEVIVKEITASEYMELYNSETVKDDKGEFDGNKFAALLATRCIVDQKGKRIFDDSDAEPLRAGSTSEYTKILLKVKQLNGIGEAKN